jgi:hypothetical protein
MMKCLDITPLVCEELGGCAVLFHDEFTYFFYCLDGEGALPLGINNPVYCFGSCRWVTLTICDCSYFLLTLANCLSS